METLQNRLAEEPEEEYWQVRFDEEFPDSRGVFESGDPYNSRRNAIKSFISKLLLEPKEEATENIYQTLQELQKLISQTESYVIRGDLVRMYNDLLLKI